MGTHHRGSAREKRVLDAYIKLARAVRAIADRTAPRLAEHELIESQFGILEALLHLGPQRASDLGSKVLTSCANITVQVDRLARRGLVKRRRCDEDRRVVWVELTHKGRALIEKVFPFQLGGLVEEFGPLTDDELEVLAHLARKLGLNAATLARAAAATH